ncbi:hypothetical protein M7I_8090 [Glarea lozoyensis 74030]|nr:hypothetical protein M7I_8090 [Glarea lozoyensis 74030]
MSDNIQQMKNFGLIPFGGGGIFISVPLAAKLTDPRVWKACMELPNDQGDQIVNECLRAHSTIRTTYDLNLHQMDFHGDASVLDGYYESGRQMLTVHHWRSWYNVDMPALAYVSKACGDEGILMRWLFADDIVLSNGYSVVEYPNGIEIAELAKVEHTWNEPPDLALHRIGPIRERMGKGDKSTYRMLDTEILEGYGVRQTYVRRVERLEKGKDEKGRLRMEAVGEDGVVELIWVF